MEPEKYTVNNSSDKFNHSGLFWRFLPLYDDYDVLLSRDCDSRISQREVDSVNEWLNSDKDFHIMRDHPYHTVPILSGMWGSKKGILKNIDFLLKYWKEYTYKGKFQADDQDFLGQIIYPIVYKNAIEHCDFNINFGGKLSKFPSTRKNYEFVGDVFDENNMRHPDYWKLLINL